MSTERDSTIAQLEDEIESLKYLLARCDVALRQANIFVVNAERWDTMNEPNCLHMSTKTLERISNVLRDIEKEEI
jgi:hypothetical protein